MKKYTIKKLQKLSLAHFCYIFLSFLLISSLCLQSENFIKNETNESILFNYKNESLTAIINYLAGRLEKNIIFPQGGLALPDIKVTFDYKEKITIKDAWDTLIPTILDVAGLSMCEKDGITTIIKNDKDIGKEPMPIYIGTSPDNLPDTDQRIRYLYYLTNIKITLIKDTLKKLFSMLLPADTVFETDTLSNSFVLCAKTNDIKGAMQIVSQLDQTGFQEELEIVPLNHTVASVVAAMFNESILKSTQAPDRYRLDSKKEPRDTYFSDSTKIIPYAGSNSLIILGRSQAITRIKQFIYNYIDVELESGQSILHVYQLQYLDAAELKPVLEKIIESENIGGTGQSRSGQEPSGGTERFFGEVIIIADNINIEDKNNINHFGGNNLIIAARNDDWKQIKVLIEKLDQPLSQILIEILIADLTLTDRRNLGSIIRNPAHIPFGNINFQSAQFGQIITDSTSTLIPPSPPPTTIKSDLLSNTDINTTTGATLISLNDSDGKTFSLLEIINKLTQSKVLSHPYIITTNNKEAFVKIGETRLLPDQAAGSTGSAAIQTFKPIPADLTITITPRISAGELINLQIDISIDQFAVSNPKIGNKINRHLTTNANVMNKTILPLGGLIVKGNRMTQNETPFLSKIPILGNFFKGSSEDLDETNLTIFILPTKLDPRLQPGISKSTKDYVRVTEQYAKEGHLFNDLRDPITRWYFKSDHDTAESLNNFLAKDGAKFEPIKNSIPSSTPNTSEKNNTDTTTVVFNKKEQAQHLKEMLKNTENPFKNKTS